MIYLILCTYVKHRMQITQQRLEYVLGTLLFLIYMQGSEWREK